MLDQTLVEMLDRMLTVRKQASVPSVMPDQKHHLVLEQMVAQKQRRHRLLLTAVQIRSLELVVKAGQTLIRLHQQQKPDRSQAVKACQRRMLDQMWTELLVVQMQVCQRQSPAGLCWMADRILMLQARQ